MSFIGVVLAGGQSRRMGSDKALLTLNGQTMLARTLNCLSQTDAEDIIISRNAPIEKGLRDIYPNKGPISGIHAAAIHKPNQNLLIVPVDLPYLSSKTLQKLIKHSQEQHCSSYFAEHNLPLYLQNNVQTVEILEQILLHSENYSVGNFIQQIGAQSIQPIDDQHLLNTNHPKQWQQAQQDIQLTPQNTIKET